MCRIERVAGLLLLLCSALAVLFVPTCHAGDYAFRVDRLYTTGRCWNLDDNTGEEFVWKFEIGATGSKKCFWKDTFDDNNPDLYPGWDINFSTTKNEIQVEIEMYEKDADGDPCTWNLGQDDEGQRKTEIQRYTVGTMAEGSSFGWTSALQMPDDDGACWFRASGTITRLTSDAAPGSPRITSTKIEVTSGSKLELTVVGRELNPDPDEKPVVQIFGPQMACVESSMVISTQLEFVALTLLWPFLAFTIKDSQIKCTLTLPESDKVSNLETQVQIQTVYGVSRSATVVFPTCASACQNNGTCWWSKGAIALECVCTSYLYYGAQCQNKYPDGEPILQAVSPIGGDYTKEIVIAVSGRAYPDSDPSIQAICEVSWSGSNQRIAASGDRIETVRDVVWSGPLVPYDNRPISQADSLTLRGLCIVPQGTFSRPTADKREAMVTLIWRRAAISQDISSRDSRRFLLYGPFSPASSTVQVVSNEADGEIRVFRDQTLRVVLADADGNNRVGGEDADLFSLSWHDGPSTEPLFGIKGGDAKAFRYSECRRKPDNPQCAYYELTMSFDFAGRFKGNVYTTDPSSLALVTINKAEVIYDVKGLGEVALPVPSRAPSSIAWADKLKDRSDIPIFDKNLAQLVSPNTGAKDRANVLGPLFQRWKGGWFTQRQTLSLGLETALSQVTLGSVHVIRGQGLNEPAFCDAHTDELDAGALAKTVTPWQSKGNVPGKFPLTGLGFSDGDCITSLVVHVELVHRNPDSVSLTLTRKGMPNTSPRAKNITTDIVLKVATTNSAPLGSGVPSPTTLTYTMESVPKLASLKGLPALADWVLTVNAPASRGHIAKWYIDIQSEYCLKSSQVDNSICGYGGGQLYARAANEEDVLRLECPQGGVISEIMWARFGKLDGSCEEDSVTVYDDCEATRTIVEQRVASVCVGHTSCELAAIDTQFADEIGEPYLCPGELPPCPDQTSLLTDEDSAGSQSKRSDGSTLKRRDREHHSKERELPWSYPGTEDHYYKNTHVRHVAEPFFRPRRANEAPTCTYSNVRPKKALMVKAKCADSNAAFKSTDSPPVEKRMLMASASADFDNDWKDETITLFGYQGGALHAAFTYIEASRPTTAVYKSLTIGGSPVVLGGQIEMQTGDFDNDGYPELVFGFIDGTTGALQVFLWDLAIDDEGVWGAGNNKLSRTNLQPCGCFDRTAIMRNLFDTAMPLPIPGSPSFPVMLPSGARLDSLGFSYSLTAGDVGMFGFDMLAVAWIEDSSTVAWTLYQQNETTGLSPVSQNSLRSVRRPHAVTVNLANYEGSGSSELALGVADDSEVRVYLYAIDQSEEEYPMKQTKVLTAYPSSSPALWGADPAFAQRINLRMISGDLDDDGDAEVVLAFTTDQMAHIFRIDAPGTGTKCRRLDCMELFGRFEYELPLGPVDASAAPTRSRELRMAIGNVDDTYANELLVAVEYTSTADPSVQKVMLTSLTAQPNVDDPFAVNGRHCYRGPHYQEGEELDTPTINNMALTVGNLYGLGFRVGEPSTVRFEGVPELIAVLNAPPTHYDVLDGADVIVNPGTFHGAGSFSQLSNIEGVVSSFEVTRETARAETNSHGFQLNAKIAVVFGNVDLAWQKFKSNSENTGSATTEQIAVARDMVASGDDSVLYISTDKDLWKYPIVDQNGNQVGTLDIWLSSSCGERCVQKADGRDLWWFTPDHEPFNILTYPARAPSDFNPVNRIMVGEKVTMGANAHEQWVDQQSGRSQNKVILNHSADRKAASGSVGVSVGVDYIFSGAFMGVGPQIKLPIGISVSTGYAGGKEESDENMDSATSSASINRDASVHSYLEAISPEHAYRVQPYVYIARTMAGQEYLKVDYSAEPGHYPGVSNWWQRKYSKPDPTFNLPWWWTTFKRDRTMLTKEMVASPPFPKLGEVVQVTVTVRNKAMVQASDVSVSLWRGSPDNCLDLTCLFPGRTLIGATRINIIPAQSQRDVSFLFKFDGTNNIHATLDDDDEINETHEDNNHGYSLVFHNLRDNGYTLQNVALDKTVGVKAVKGGVGKKYTQGYDLSVTVLGDTFTRQNVLVQMWHGSVGGSGRLISTITVPRIRGSVISTTRYTLSAYWDTRNTALYGQQEIHAVILHSGFDTTPDNIISHVVQTVNVACFGEVDVCGVCGGDNSLCAGCDGVPLSGKTVDICGKCGGDGSTCCVRRPSQASVQYVRLGDDASSKIRRVKVGDMVVWENMLDWNVKITGGVYDYLGAPTFELETLKNRGFDIQGEVPPMTLDDDTVNAYVQKYMTSMLVIKDHTEPDGTNPAVPTPVPDATSQYLKRSASSQSSFMPAHTADHFGDYEDDVLGLSRFPGWRVDEPMRRVSEARLRSLREAHQERRRSESHYFGDDEYDDELVEDFAMNGICCAEPEYDEDDEDFADEEGFSTDQSARRQSERRQAVREEQRRHAMAQLKSHHRRSNAKNRGKALPGSKPTATELQPAFSLRKLALSMLDSRKRQLDHLSALLADDEAANSTVASEVQQTAAQRKRELLSYFEDYQQEDSHDDEAALDEVRCLCPNARSKRVTRIGAKKGAKAKATGGTTTGGKAAKPEAKPKEGASEGAPAAKPEENKPEDNGEASFGDGELGAPEVGTAASMQMTTSYGVAMFSGFGAARGWATYDFAELARTAEGDPAVMAPGAASAPHRFFSPGIYVWHDSNNPALHGTIIVDPSDLQKDACGVCGGNGTSCLDCKGTPRGRARRDVCGVCYDPFVDTYDPEKAKDCAGVCNGTAKIDECGFCTGGSTGRLSGFAKDCMGVCNGSTPEFCGQCGADRDTHAHLADCAGECGGPRKLNPCGHCVGGDTGLDISHGMDCAGTCNGNAVRDCTGVCLGTAKIDCAGVCGGTARINECLRCVGGSSGLDGPMTKTCAGVCAITESEVCGFNGTTAKRFDQDETSDTVAVTTDERQATSCGGVVDKRGTCCAANELDCANLCFGSATVECGVCVGGSSGKDVNEFKDCLGVCNGTARYNPCGVCATPENYYNGSGYTVDCNNVCNGSAYIDDCGKCAEGSTGVAPNADKDCQGQCFGNATRDDCNVCYLPGDGFEPNSWQDCAGVCNGTAVLDDCQVCALGTTRRDFNADKDCAGQCFGQHVITDPACSCPAGQLDQCFVCGGNNTQCAGCDGIPWSGTKRDFCGVCGGNNTQCCFLPFAQTTATIKDFEAIILRDTLETGEKLAITNLQAGHTYTLIMYRLDVPAEVARVKQIQTRWDYAALRPGNTLEIIIQEPGLYRITSVESSSVSFALRVSYNTKEVDVCGRCVYAAESARNATFMPTPTSTSTATTEYHHCCAIMPFNDVHGWFATTYYYEPHRPELVTRVAHKTAHYPRGAHQHRVRLVEPQTVDSSTWWNGKRVAVGDVLVLENRDALDHVISFSGPQPVPDLLLERGTTTSTPPFLKPGTYRLLSNRNLVNTTFTVEFEFSCSVYAEEPQPDDHTLLIVLTSVLGGSLIVVVALLLVLGAVAAIVYNCTRPKVLKDPATYPL